MIAKTILLLIVSFCYDGSPGGLPLCITYAVGVKSIDECGSRMEQLVTAYRKSGYRMRGTPQCKQYPYIAPLPENTL